MSYYQSLREVFFNLTPEEQEQEIAKAVGRKITLTMRDESCLQMLQARYPSHFSDSSSVSAIESDSVMADYLLRETGLSTDPLAEFRQNLRRGDIVNVASQKGPGKSILGASRPFNYKELQDDYGVFASIIGDPYVLQIVRGDMRRIALEGHQPPYDDEGMPLQTYFSDDPLSGPKISQKEFLEIWYELCTLYRASVDAQLKLSDELHMGFKYYRQYGVFHSTFPTQLLRLGSTVNMILNNITAYRGLELARQRLATA